VSPLTHAAAVAALDLWRASLAPSDAELARVAGSVSAEERSRAARFRLERDRRRFLAARGTLRHILAAYLATAPARLDFRYGAQGKPFLVDHPELQFNLSHAADVLLVGVARGLRLGVDVEQTIPERVMDEVVGTVSSEPELGFLQALQPAARPEYFSRLWTRKEAYIKADGRGMSLDLKRIDVLSVPGVLRMAEHASAWRPCRPWTVRDLELGPGLAGAVVAEGADWRVTELEWRSDAP
jgi:4'-phosphopantetheinyl transferase